MEHQPKKNFVFKCASCLPKSLASLFPLLLGVTSNVARVGESGASFSKKPSERSVIFKKNSRAERLKSVLYLYIQKNMQNAKLVADYMKTCVFVLLVDEYYIIMKLEMPSIVH
jgi:hypothetical protein